MLNTMKRKLYLNINKYQRPILNLSVAATFITIVVLAGCVSFLSYDIANLVLDAQQEIPTIKFVVSIILMILPVSYLIIIYYSLRISSQMVGAVERLLKELDEVIEKREKRELTVRKNDAFLQDLLKRINILISRMS